MLFGQIFQCCHAISLNAHNYIFLIYLHIFTNIHNGGEHSKDSKTGFIKVYKSSEQFTMISNKRCNWKLIR